MVGLVAIATACGGSPAGRDPVGQSSSPAVASSPTALVPLASAPGNSAPGNSAPGARVPGSTAAPNAVPPAPPAPSRAVAPDRLPVPLIPPTQNLERLPQVRVGRSDPFAAVGTEPVVISMPPPAAPAAPAAPVAVAPPAVAVAPVPSQPAGTGAPTVLPPVPVPVAPPVAVAPPATTPSLARRIEISGVVQIGDRVNLIVQVPQESTSRTVRAGEYLGNGTVLVKHIEVAPNREPRVILVENGVEIVRTVGDGGSLMSAR